MHFVEIAAVAACATLAACGGSRTGQANNAQANIGNDAAPPPTANGGVTANGMAMLAMGPVRGADALKIMHERHDAMEQLGKSMKALHGELEGSNPNAEVVRTQAATMASIAGRIPKLFPPGTGPEAGKTRAKPEIWQRQAVFLARAKDFQNAARELDAAARSGDGSRVMAAHEPVDKACKACHDLFRAPEH
jgi:cytochrome c556